DLSNEYEKNLVLLEKRLQQDESGSSGQIYASYGDLSFNAGQAKQARSSLFTLLDLHYTVSEKSNVYIWPFTAEQLKAYADCMRSRDISHNFQGDILARDSFFVTVNWHPTYRVTGPNQRFVAKLTEGTFVENGKQKYESRVRDKDAELLTVKRDR